MKFSFFIFFLLLSIMASAKEEACHEILNMKTPSFSKKVGLLKDGIRARLFLNSLVTLESLKVDSPFSEEEEILLKTTGKNLIFSLGPTPDKLAALPPDHVEKYNEDWNQYELEAQKLTSLIKAVKNVRRCKYLEDKRVCLSEEAFLSHRLKICREKKEELAFNEERYKELAGRHQGVNLYQQMYSNKVVIDQVKKIQRDLKLEWTVIESTSLKEVFETINKSDAENVIIVGHGNNHGRLYDSNLEMYPNHFFKNISNRVRSIGFYSCFSKKTVEMYKIEEAFKEAPSIDGSRQIFFLAENDFQDKGAVSILTGLQYFLKDVDQELSKQPVLPKIMVSAPKCSISMEKKFEGRFMVTANDAIVGFADEMTSSIKTNFSCQEINQIAVKPVSPYSIMKGSSELFLLDENRKIFFNGFPTSQKGNSQFYKTKDIP